MPPLLLMKSPKGRALLRTRLRNMREMYEYVYIGYPLFHRIATNVFDIHQQQIG